MNHEYVFECEGNNVTLADSVEIIALGIAECVIKKEKRTKEIMQCCKILDSLSGALNAIKE